jgi:hypothetical protein
MAEALPTRREVFRLTAGAAVGNTIAYTVTSDGGPAVVAAQEVQQALAPLQGPARSSIIRRQSYPLLENVVVADNPGIYHGSHSTTAFAVVHADYARSYLTQLRHEYDTLPPNYLIEKSIAQPMIDMADGRLGSLTAHQGRLSRLLRKLDTSIRPVLAYLEETDFYDATVPAASLAPPAQAFQIATQPASGLTLLDVNYKHHNDSRVYTAPQLLPTLYETLAQRGVTRVLMAGAFTFNPWTKTPDSLGDVALGLMDAGFEIRGISGAVYPSIEQVGIDHTSELARDLYAQAVPYAQAIHIAGTQW